jgi:hypothetical protein
VREERRAQMACPARSSASARRSPLDTL